MEEGKFRDPAFRTEGEYAGTRFLLITFNVFSSGEEVV